MDTMRICAGCKKPLAPNAPQGLCPECLLKAGLGSGVDIGPDSHSQAESGERGKARFVAPTADELVERFPQMEILGFIGQGVWTFEDPIAQPSRSRWIRVSTRFAAFYLEMDTGSIFRNGFPWTLP